MPGRPAKTLLELVADRSFRARRESHVERLVDAPDLPWDELARIQRRFRRSTRTETRTRIALEFERAVRGLDDVAAATGGIPAAGSDDLAAILAELGPPGSAERAIAFFPRFFRHTKGPKAGEPFELDDYQKAFLREAFRRHPDGTRVYQRIYLYVPGGNGKTPLAAGLGLLALCELEDDPEVYVIAGAGDQAAIGIGYAQTFVNGTDEQPGELRRWLKVSGNKITNRRTDGEMTLLASSGRRQEGKNPSVIIVDELHAFEDKHQLDTYVALSGKLYKRGLEAYLIAISTAGRGEDNILRRILLRARGFPSIKQRGYLTVYSNETDGVLVWAYEAPHNAPLHGPQGLEVIRKVNPASWLDPPAIVKALADEGVGEAEFRRLARNEWIAQRHAWLPIGALGQLKVGKRPPKGTDVVLGFDGSYDQDATALVGWTRPDHVFVVEVWERPQQEPDWIVPRAEVKKKLEWAMEHWNVLALICDPPGWAEEIAEWEAMYGDVVHVKFLTNETRLMAEACKEFYAGVVHRSISWDADERLGRHLTNAVTRETPDGAYITKERRNSPRKIDAAVAAVIARYTGLRIKPKKRRRVVSW